jgi:hypothetical protein
LRSNELRRWIALADAKIVAQGGVPAIGRGHHLTWTIAFDFACRVACRTLHVIAFVSDIMAFEPDGRWRGDYSSIRGGLVAVKD